MVPCSPGGWCDGAPRFRGGYISINFSVPRGKILIALKLARGDMVAGRQNIGSKKVTGKILQHKQLGASDVRCETKTAWVSSLSRGRGTVPIVRLLYSRSRLLVTRNVFFSCGSVENRKAGFGGSPFRDSWVHCGPRSVTATAIFDTYLISNSMSGRNLDAKGLCFYSLPGKPCYSSLELSLRAQLWWDSPSSSARPCQACQTRPAAFSSFSH